MEDILIEYFTAGLKNPKTLAKALDNAEIYEYMLRKNTNFISKVEYQIPPIYTPFDSTIPSPPSITSTQIGDPYGEPRSNEYSCKY